MFEASHVSTLFLTASTATHSFAQSIHYVAASSLRAFSTRSLKAWSRAT